jgi:NDP-sugar pyrophosphorylase family protein
MMRAVVLTGGQMTRPRPTTHTMPKALAALRNKPLMDTLARAVLEGAVLCSGYLPNRIQRYCAGEGLGSSPRS